MQDFHCRVCAARLYFENSVCVTCGTPLGYARAERAIVPVDATGRYVDGEGLVWHVCRNLTLSGCTWLAALPGGQCAGCDLTRTRPSDGDLLGLTSFPAAEQAKRHLVVELDALGLPVVGKHVDPVNGLAFDLLSSVQVGVVTGHQDGVITIDLAESDGAHRERVRAQLAEPYRTMLGHFRHEVGHYYQWQLVRGAELTARFTALFGDPGQDYPAAVERHYREGARPGWQASHISAYATMHPFEDFAETWAHHLHIRDTVETAQVFGLAPPIAATRPDGAPTRFRDVVREVWVPLSLALNQLNRSMGKDDLYPFVIPAPVLDKLDFVAELAAGGA